VPVWSVGCEDAEHCNQVVTTIAFRGCAASRAQPFIIKRIMDAKFATNDQDLKVLLANLELRPREYKQEIELRPAVSNARMSHRYRHYPIAKWTLRQPAKQVSFVPVFVLRLIGISFSRKDS
jgi:hypothetical protein